jgi:hypothetical protein
MPADRNLLFGILALQMDFISRDALIAAMHAWVLAKTEPLGKILREQRVLAEEEHVLLEALVDKHLQRHGNDAEKSLAALSSVGSVASELRQIGDPELQASLANVSANRPYDDPLATRVVSMGTPTSSGQRFRILRPHRKGGLGEVFVAHDEELHRDVALKEIQDQFADHPESRSRFLLEAEITGGSHHQLGQKELAQAALARLRHIADKPKWAKDQEVQSLLREAEILMAGKTATAKE